MDEARLRAGLIRAGEKLEEMDLNRGMSGNISARYMHGMLISASGAQLGELQEEEIVFVDAQGSSNGEYPPSSEWRIHRDIYVARPEFSAIVHTHSIAATTLACLRLDIPPLHYMIVRAGSRSIPCASYATFGTQELSDRVVEALAGRKACLLANHGMIAAGSSVFDATMLAGEVESLAELYLRTTRTGCPHLLSDEELEAAERQFRDLRYGRR